jgi:hypothetical protein
MVVEREHIPKQVRDNFGSGGIKPGDLRRPVQQLRWYQASSIGSYYIMHFHRSGIPKREVVATTVRVSACPRELPDFAIF